MSDESPLLGVEFIRRMFKETPDAKAKLDGLLEMPGFAQLVEAIEALNEDELRSALLLLIHSEIKSSYPPEGYEEWVQGGPGGVPDTP